MVSSANTTREFVVDGRPCVTGLVPIGDAWGFTNPSLGRGISLAVMHAVAFADAAVPFVDQPDELFQRWDEVTRTVAAPWHASTVSYDAVRGPEIEALRQGLPDPSDADDLRSRELVRSTPRSITTVRSSRGAKRSGGASRCPMRSSDALASSSAFSRSRWRIPCTRRRHRVAQNLRNCSPARESCARVGIENVVFCVLFRKP